MQKAYESIVPCIARDQGSLSFVYNSSFQRKMINLSFDRIY